MKNNPKIDTTFNAILRYLLIGCRGYFIHNLTINTKFNKSFPAKALINIFLNLIGRKMRDLRIFLNIGETQLSCIYIQLPVSKYEI